MSQASPARWRPVVEEIEPRILYSADFSPALLDGAPAAPAVEHRIVDAAGEFIGQTAAEQRTRSHEVVFIDTATPDYRKLAADIQAQSGPERRLDVILLEPGADGVSEISATLAGMQDVSAVHIIGHGADGQIELGATTLNFESLLRNASRIQGWGDALAPGADLLIYGCDVAQHADGRALIDALGRLTGAAVAASEDPTGAAAQGGDWNLEYATGWIETSMALSPPEQATWSWLLDINSKLSSVASPADPAPTADAQPEVAPAQTSAQDGPSTPESAAAAGARVSVPSLALAFERNVGQAGAELEFLAQGSGYAVGLVGGDALIALEDATSSHVVRLDVVGKNANISASGDGLLEAKTNYFVGSPDQWHTGIDNYGAVRYDNVYDGIGLRYYGNQGQLEYDFIVNAGADVGAIRLNFEGVQGLSIADNGDLVLTLDSAGHRLFFQAPVAYQDGPDGRQAVSAHYHIGADGTVGFEIGDYDTSRQLVIDPVLSYGSYFGGTGAELANGIAVDAAGNVYLTGYTQSTGLLGLLGLSGGAEVFVAKYSPNLGSLIYSSYVGGARDDVGTSVALDASGNAYVTGYTQSTDFPTFGAYQASRSGSQDAFVFKLNAAGSALTYSTYLGGNGSTDEGWAIAVDASGSAYVTGVASSSVFPVTPGAADTSYSGGDAFVTKLNPAGNALVYSTFIGGSGAETGFGIAVDAFGSAVVVGNTASNNLPVTADAFQLVYGGSTDAFVTRLNVAGTAFTYMSYLGGNKIDIAYNLALDDAGKIYLTGQTSSTLFFPVSGNALQATLSGTGAAATDAFVSVIDPSVGGAASLVYSTYLGGTKNIEAGLGVSVDAGGRIYVAGQTDSSNFASITAGAYKTTNPTPSKADAFLVVIDPVASAAAGLIYGTYFGGTKDDYGDIGVYSNGKYYLAGDTLSTSGIANNGTSYGGSGATDAFVAIFNLAPIATATSVALPYVENDGARVLDAAFTASDAGIANLAGATLQITGNYANGEDLLAFTNAFGITGTWNATSGTLTLLGSSSVANYQTAVRSVTYQNTSDNPSTAARSVTVVVSDGVLSSAPATRQITVAAVNDPPVNSVPGTQSTNEDTALVFSLANGNLIAIGDVDAGTGAVQVTLSVTSGRLTLAQTTGLTFVTGNGTDNTAMTFTGDLSSVNAALDGLRFDPTADFNGGASLQIVTNDQGNTGSGGSLTATSTVAIAVVAINDAPVNSLPGPQSTQVDTALVFSSAGGNAITVGDVDAGSGTLTLTLTPDHGQLTLGPGPYPGLASVAVNGAGAYVLTGTLTGLNSALDGLVFQPDASFTGTASVQIVTDDQGNTGTGGSGIGTSTVFIIVSADIAPTITTSGSALGYTENDSATAVDPALTVSDPDSTQLEYAVVHIAANYVSGEDVLDFTDQAGITGSWDDATGTLTLTGPADVADYQTALRSITYQNLSDDPSTATRSVWFVVNDGVADGAIASLAIDVTAENDAPVNLVPVAQDTDEDTGLVFSAANGNAISIADPDAGNNSIEVELTAVNGTLSLAQISGLTVAAGADGTSSMTLAGTIDDINAALNGLRFDAVADFHGAASVQIATSDLGNSGAGGTQFATDSVGVTVASVNDAPQGADLTVGLDEDTTYTFAISDFGFDDALDTPSNQLMAVQITTLPGTGSLVNDSVTVTAGQLISVADITAGKLQFAPPANDNGVVYASFTFQVQDDGGSAHGGVDLDPTARTMTIDVDAVDDSPQITPPSPQTTNENTALVFSTANGNVWTVDDIDAGGNPVQVTLSVTHGTLTLADTTGLTFSSGTGTGDADMIFSGSLTALDAALDGLTYTPTAFYNGSAALLVGVDDLGNSGSGGPLGVLLSQAITITPVSSAPEGTDQTVTVLEEGTYTFAAADFGFSDAHDTPSNSFLGVQITAPPGVGTLTVSGVAVTAGQFVTLTDIGAGLLQFTPAANGNGAGYAGFTFQVQDDGGTAIGGADLDPTPRTMTIDVTAVDDAPAGTDHTATVLEDTSYVFAAADFGFSDAADLTDSLAAVKVVTLPGLGLLTNDGAAVNAGDFVSAADIAAGKLQFTPASGVNGAGYASFTFQVQDDGGTANGGVDIDPLARTMTIDVAAVNDAPQGSDQTITALEDTAYTFATVDFGFADPGDTPADNLLTVRITSLPGLGLLTDDGATVSAGDYISQADIASGKLRFAPAADASGAAYASFTFQVQDDGGVANGGIDLDPAARVMTIDVTAVNDAPVLAQNRGVTVTAGSGVIIRATRLDVIDIDNSPSQLIFTVSSLPSAGTLRLAGAALGLNSTFTQADVDSGRLRYQSTGVTGGADSFVFSVADGAGGSIGATTFAITINSPPPVVAPLPAPPPVATPNPGSGSTTPAPPAPPPAPSPSAGGSAGAPGGSTPGPGSGPAAGGEAVQPIDAGMAAAVRTAPSSALSGNDGKGRGADPVKAPPAGAGFGAPAFGGPALIGGVQDAMPFAQTETLTISASDPGFSRASEAVRLEGYRSSLGNRAWVGELDRMREDAGGEEVKIQHKIVVDSTVAVTGAMSVGYVIWLLRGGLLLSSLLSSLPAWHIVDPMPVLARSDRAEDEGEGDDPLEKLFGRAKAAIGLGRGAAEPPTLEPEAAPAAEIADVPVPVVAHEPGAPAAVPA